MTKPQADAERRWAQDNCPYCHEDDEWLVDNENRKRLYVRSNGLVEMWNFCVRIKIHYCPMCGRKLDGK